MYRPCAAVDSTSSSSSMETYFSSGASYGTGAPETTQTLPSPPFFLPHPPPFPVARRLLPPMPPPPITGPTVFRLHPAFVAQMDHHWSNSLLQFLRDEGAFPSPEEDKTRVQVISKLKKIVMEWAKVVAYNQRVPPRRATATVLTYGSYTLGAHGPESDIDALCVGPCIATLQYHFFVELRQILEGRSEVSGLQTVENAKVPLMRFRFSGIPVDFTYAQLPAIDAVQALNGSSQQILQRLDSRSWRSLSGVRVNEQIIQFVPNAEKFQVLLRCIKLWARRRGLYCHLLGFFAGIHLAILAAYVCQKYPKASVNGLFMMFFDTFAHWPWPSPVDLHGQPSDFRPSDGYFMPIVMPCTPPELCASSITRGTFRKIREELMCGYALTKNLLRHDFEWARVFAPFPYAAKYGQFLRIALCAPTSEELVDWTGWVKSRCRHLILKLESLGVECDPDSTAEVDHTIMKPNVVYHWGLISQTNTHLDTNSLREDFMEDVINDVYGKVKCTKSELTISIVGASQLPKSMYSESSFYCWYMPPCYQTSADWFSAVG